MFIVSFKPTLKKLCMTLASVFVIVLAISILVDGGNTMSASKLLSEEAAEDKRVSYITKFGWEINKEPIEQQQVRIPAEFNDVYKKYNVLQKKQDFDLEKHMGSVVTRYTYEVLNYDGEKEFVRANLLVYKNKIIGADICSLRLDGFMHGMNENTPK